MTQHELISRLKAMKPELNDQFGIEKIGLFGSYARDEATENSDIDIAVLKMALKSGFDLLRAKKFLQDRLGKEIDIGTFDSMNTFIKNRLKKEMIYV
ncbi:MAG: nucleotidyltransferase family protein [Campylobacterales bacterium]|nr:nucleotidyltransferase family protein [Campylobacterales bacterium]